MKKWTQTNRGMHFLWIPIPASASIPFFVALLHISWWTFLIALVVAIFQIVMKKKGRNIVWIFRRLKGRISGGVVYARSLWYRRRLQRRDGFDLIDLRGL